MTQLVIPLPHKYDDLSSNTQHPLKGKNKAGQGTVVVKRQHEWCVGKRISQSCLPCSPAGLESSGFSERLPISGGRWQALEEDFCRWPPAIKKIYCPVSSRKGQHLAKFEEKYGTNWDLQKYPEKNLPVDETQPEFSTGWLQSCNPPDSISWITDNLSFQFCQHCLWGWEDVMCVCVEYYPMNHLVTVLASPH